MADKAGSVAKTRILPKYGPGRAGFAFLRSDNRLWSDLDGTRRPLNFDNVLTMAADRTLVGKESGSKVVVNSATTLTLTLPAPAVGLEFTVFVKVAAGSGAGHTIAPTSGAKVFAKGITAANGKGLINTQATGAIGDAVWLWSDGTDWFAELSAGTWARVA